MCNSRQFFKLYVCVEENRVVYSTICQHEPKFMGLLEATATAFDLQNPEADIEEERAPVCRNDNA